MFDTIKLRLSLTAGRPVVVIRAEWGLTLTFWNGESLLWWKKPLDRSRLIQSQHWNIGGFIDVQFTQAKGTNPPTYHHKWWLLNCADNILMVLISDEEASVISKKYILLHWFIHSPAWKETKHSHSILVLGLVPFCKDISMDSLNNLISCTLNQWFSTFHNPWKICRCCH